jgi:hypothetical protein
VVIKLDPTDKGKLLHLSLVEGVVQYRQAAVLCTHRVPIGGVIFE